jgi:L-iditol 2-dehydrogenase
MAARRALVIARPGSMHLEEVAEAVPGSGEVAIRPAYVGICGTDLELLAGDVDPAYVRYPLVPGHEWSGKVESVGSGVTGLEPGQRVIVEGIVPCRVCARCIRGETNLCEQYDELGFTRPGAAAEQVIVPAQLVHVLASSVSMQEAALAEPAAVAWRAIGRGRPVPGERVAIVGDGTIGLIAAHLVDLGASAFEVWSHDQSAKGSDPAGAGRFDLVIEAAGTPSAAESAIALARRGGRVVLVGLAGACAAARLPIDQVINNDLQISASFAYTSGVWSDVANLLSFGQVRLGPLITHRFALDAFATAYQALRDGAGPRGKVLLEVAP